jgi:hypothetical protein
MASTPVILLQKRSGNSSDRPNTTTVQAGEAAMSFGSADPGLYFKDSAGSIRKFGSNHYGTTAPNSSPVGSTGNSVGETWVDSSTSNYYLRVWTGAAWQKVGAGFADSASTASTASTASVAEGINVVTTLPAAYTGGVVYLNTGASGLYVSANGGWILT